MEGKIPLIIKWSGKEYEVYISEDDSVADLKREILYKTAVRPERQKLLNLKLKGMLCCSGLKSLNHSQIQRVLRNF